MRNLLMGLIVLLFTLPAYSQNNAEKASTLAKQAIAYMEAQNFVEALQLLDEAQILDPSNLDYPYEEAYAYYLYNRPEKAIIILEKLISTDKTNIRFYQLLGAAYRSAGMFEEALNCYERGMQRFPNQGYFYTEAGILEFNTQHYETALFYFEKGIQEAPKAPSNYYWATKLYLNSREEVWGMIYGEIFLNIEPSSRRSTEISRLLYQVYVRQIVFFEDASAIAVFGEFPKQVSTFGKSPQAFVQYVYNPLHSKAAQNESRIDLEAICRIRTIFLETYYTQNINHKYPNILFEWQRKIQKAGHLEAYNRWVLMGSDLTLFEKWIKENPQKFKAFGQWFSKNKMPVSEDYTFYRTQYITKNK